MEISDVWIRWTGHLFAIHRPARVTIDRERRRAGTRVETTARTVAGAQRVTRRRIISGR